MVIPVYNEEHNLPRLYEELIQALTGLADLEWRLLFVDDGSSDRSLEIIRGLAENNSQVTYLALSRNFGKENALSAGLHQVDADAALMLDADLQHPPAVIPQLVAAWRAGAEIVIGVRTGPAGEPRLKRCCAALYYWIMRQLSSDAYRPQETDFRLIDRRVLDAFKRLTEHSRLTRGLLNWLGFRRAYVEFVPRPRLSGRPTYGFVKLVHVAVYSLVSQSYFPLRLAGYLGLAITFVSGLLGLFVFLSKYVLHDPFKMHFSGTSFLALLNLFLIGVVLGCLGLVALYIANIHTEVTNRPLYVIRERKL